MKQNFAVVMLALMVGSCAEKEEKPEAFSSVYLVEVEVHINGKRKPVLYEDITVTQGSYTMQWNGSATAVSPDGDLLTARHVVDVSWDHSELCAECWIDVQNEYALREAHIGLITLTITGPDGDTWHGYGAMPIDGWPCDDDLVPRIEWYPISTATVVAMDARSDLALISIEADGLEHLQLERQVPVWHEELVALGLPGGTREVRTGPVLLPCLVKPNSRLLFPMPMLQVWFELKRGMSGGPIVDGNRLLGINAQIGKFQESYAVSGFYAALWYDWVRGVSPERPGPFCIE